MLVQAVYHVTGCIFVSSSPASNQHKTLNRFLLEDIKTSAGQIKV
jgi:hypothetical protein